MWIPWGNTAYHSSNDSISSALLEIFLLIFSSHSPSISTISQYILHRTAILLPSPGNKLCIFSASFYLPQIFIKSWHDYLKTNVKKKPNILFPKIHVTFLVGENTLSNTRKIKTESWNQNRVLGNHCLHISCQRIVLKGCWEHYKNVNEFSRYRKHACARHWGCVVFFADRY